MDRPLAKRHRKLKAEKSNNTAASAVIRRNAARLQYNEPSWCMEKWKLKVKSKSLREEVVNSDHAFDPRMTR